MVSIHVCPPEFADRLLSEHWESDLIKGAGSQSSMSVPVEHTNCLVLLAQLVDTTAASALGGFAAKLKFDRRADAPEPDPRPEPGDEPTPRSSRHQREGSISVIRSHSPWQRGTYENTNGLLRQHLPKGTDLSVHTHDELGAIADSLNNRPRATHNFHSPLEVFASVLKKLDQPDSSIH
jgi:IS30 family transposase